MIALISCCIRKIAGVAGLASRSLERLQLSLKLRQTIDHLHDFRTLLDLLRCLWSRRNKLRLLVWPLSRLEDLQACLSFAKVGPEPEQILPRVTQVFDQHLLLDGRALLVVRSDLLGEFLVLLTFLT